MLVNIMQMTAIIAILVCNVHFLPSTQIPMDKIQTEYPELGHIMGRERHFMLTL